MVMTDFEFLSLVPKDSNPVYIGVSTLTIAHHVIGRALYERGYEARPCPEYALRESIEFLISKGFYVVAVGVGERPLPYRVAPIELFRKKLTEPLHPTIYPVSG